MSVETGDPEREAIVGAARGPAEEELGKPVRLAVRHLNASDGWAFLYADLQEPSGEPIDYTGTPYADAADAGGISNVYAALLASHQGVWTVTASATGPTDLAWEGWSEEHGAPESLFQLPDA